MLKISRQTDYGIVILMLFAREPKGAVLNARDLSSEANLPLPTASKILKILARGGILQSRRGAKGGYSLIRTPAEISVAQIVRALEGPIAMTACVEDAPGCCEMETWCPVRGNWQIINQAVYGALDGISLAEMARPLLDPLPLLGPAAEAGEGGGR
ncbi:MAG: SUF system Fe-S cluster assembly regulator [Planctomycetota bacterium]